MPTNPSTWSADEVISASQLNTDLYTYTGGNNHSPNGILFHSQPPMVMSNLMSVTNLGTQPSSSAGSVKNMTAAAPSWRAAIDNNALFAPGGDYMGPGAQGHYLATVPGSAGSAAAVPGGVYLFYGVVNIAATTNAGATGALFYYSGATAAQGGIQLSSTTRLNAAYVIDLQAASSSGGAFTNLGGYCADASGSNFAYDTNPTDYTGGSPIFGALWAAMDPAVNTTRATALPVPPTGYTSASTITSSNLNGNTLASPLKFLNNKPSLRATTSLSTSIPNAASPAATVVPVVEGGGGDIDNWGGWASNKYTVPVSGVYLVHGIVNFGSSSGSSRMAGVQINGTLNLWGPAYQGSGGNYTRPQIVRMLDLQAGDTVALVACQNSGGSVSLSTGYTCRIVITWLSSLASSNGSVAWTQPDTGFRWQAGTPGALLPGLFNSHLANDLSFLLQRPYCLAYQTTAQTAQPNNTINVVTMGSLTGRVHGTAGDNYGGWVSGSNNHYAAVVPGWYLCVANYIQTAPSATVQCVANLGYYQAGGAAQGLNSNQNGQKVRSTSGTYQPGAETIGLFYLRAGDYIQPQYQVQDGSSTYSTTVATGLESSFGCVWVSELKEEASGPMVVGEGYRPHWNGNSPDHFTGVLAPPPGRHPGGRADPDRSLGGRPRQSRTFRSPRWQKYYRPAVLITISLFWGIGVAALVVGT